MAREASVHRRGQCRSSIDLMISDVISAWPRWPCSLRPAQSARLGDCPVMIISGYAEAEFSKVLEGEVGVSFPASRSDIAMLAEEA